MRARRFRLGSWSSAMSIAHNFPSYRLRHRLRVWRDRRRHPWRYPSHRTSRVWSSLHGIRDLPRDPDRHTAPGSGRRTESREPAARSCRSRKERAPRTARGRADRWRRRGVAPRPAVDGPEASLVTTLHRPSAGSGPAPGRHPRVPEHRVGHPGVARHRQPRTRTERPRRGAGRGGERVVRARRPSASRRLDTSSMRRTWRRTTRSCRSWHRCR